MDKTSLIGLIIGLIVIFGPIIIAGDVLLYYDIPSLFITIGGTFAAVFVSFGIKDFLRLGKIMKVFLFHKDKDLSAVIENMVSLGERARREGILSLELIIINEEDYFVRKALQLVVDGNEASVIESIMQSEISNMVERHKAGKAIFDSLANMAPAFGMLGTLIGLIQMLKSLNDPTKIGAGMAVALITTFYGSIIANMFAIPVANKLEKRSREEINLKYLYLEGILSIQSGDNPRITRDKLETYLPPDLRSINDHHIF